jgi:hypothetical protein
MNIDMIRGDTVNIQFEVESDTVLDLSSNDFQITFSLKQAATDTEYVFQKHKTAVTQISENNFVLRIAPDDTEELIPGYYFYDLQLGIGDDIYTIALGMFQIIRDITLPAVPLPDFVYPDINDDGTVDQTDKNMIMTAYTNIMVGNPSGLTAEQENLADCNRDGRITAIDASYVGAFIEACTAGTYTNNSAGWIQYMTDRFTS